MFNIIVEIERNRDSVRHRQKLQTQTDRKIRRKTDPERERGDREKDGEIHIDPQAGLE